MSVARPECMDEAVLGVGLAAGVANIVMQLSRPGVGHGVVNSPVESGQVMRHPVKRARTTFTYLAVAIWGSDAERAAYRTAVNRSHRAVRSTAESPVAYDAFDPELQLWVAACLYHGLEDVHRALFPDSGFTGDHGIYEASHTLATSLQVPRSMWPPDRDAFEAYWQTALDEVAIDDAVRDYLRRLVDLAFLPRAVQVALGPTSRFLTTGFLPDRFREEMDLPWSDADQRRFTAVMRSIGRVERLMPAPIRHAPVNLYLLDFRLRRRFGRALV